MCDCILLYVHVCQLFWFSCQYLPSSVIFVNENENENYQKRKNNDFVNEN